MKRRSRGRAEPGVNTEGWWKEVLAGEVAARHPIHGDELKAKLTDGRLVLSGEVPSPRDRDQLVREARARVGNGLHELDVSGIKIRPRHEKPGVLAQTLVAAYDHRDTAQLALTFVIEHSRNRPKHTQVIDRAQGIRAVLPPELIDDARKQLERGRTLLLVEVDETEAFRSRALLEEDTRSVWTMSAPPHAIDNGRA